MSQYNVLSWLDEKIDNCIAMIDSNNSTSKNLKMLDELISLRKKYDSSIDHLGERIRVMEKFIFFVTENYKKDITKLKKICSDFLEQSTPQ